jgi:hypothetical protein
MFAVLVAVHIEDLCERAARTQTAAFRAVVGVAQPVGPHKFSVEALPVVARLRKLRRLHARLDLARHEGCSNLQKVDRNQGVADVGDCLRTMY